MAFAAIGTGLTVNVNLQEMGLGFSSEAIPAGAAVRELSTGRFEIADADTLAGSDISGIALCSTHAANQPFLFAKDGATLTIASPTLTKGVTYFLGATTDQGEIGLLSDVQSGDYITVVGVALSATKLLLKFVKTGTVA